MLQAGTTVKVKPVFATGRDWWWKVGTVEIVDPYADEGDYYGVKFANEKGHPFFNAEELETVSDAPKCASCGKEGVHLYEVAGMQLCGDCIAPPRQ